MSLIVLHLCPLAHPPVPLAPAPHFVPASADEPIIFPGDSAADSPPIEAIPIAHSAIAAAERSPVEMEAAQEEAPAPLSEKAEQPCEPTAGVEDVAPPLCEGVAGPAFEVIAMPDANFTDGEPAVQLAVGDVEASLPPAPATTDSDLAKPVGIFSDGIAGSGENIVTAAVAAAVEEPVVEPEPAVAVDAACEMEEAVLRTSDEVRGGESVAVATSTTQVTDKEEGQATAPVATVVASPICQSKQEPLTQPAAQPSVIETPTAPTANRGGPPPTPSGAEAAASGETKPGAGVVENLIAEPTTMETSAVASASSTVDVAAVGAKKGLEEPVVGSGPADAAKPVDPAAECVTVDQAAAGAGASAAVVRPAKKSVFKKIISKVFKTVMGPGPGKASSSSSSSGSPPAVVRDGAGEDVAVPVGAMSKADLGPRAGNTGQGASDREIGGWVRAGSSAETVTPKAKKTIGKRRSV